MPTPLFRPPDGLCEGGSGGITITPYLTVQSLINASVYDSLPVGYYSVGTEILTYWSGSVFAPWPALSSRDSFTMTDLNLSHQWHLKSRMEAFPYNINADSTLNVNTMAYASDFETSSAWRLT